MASLTGYILHCSFKYQLIRVIFQQSLVWRDLIFLCYLLHKFDFVHEWWYFFKTYAMAVFRSIQKMWLHGHHQPNSNHHNHNTAIECNDWLCQFCWQIKARFWSIIKQSNHNSILLRNSFIYDLLITKKSTEEHN